MERNFDTVNSLQMLCYLLLVTERLNMLLNIVLVLIIDGQAEASVFHRSVISWFHMEASRGMTVKF